MNEKDLEKANKYKHDIDILKEKKRRLPDRISPFVELALGFDSFECSREIQKILEKPLDEYIKYCSDKLKKI